MSKHLDYLVRRQQAEFDKLQTALERPEPAPPSTTHIRGGLILGLAWGMVALQLWSRRK